ncbi:pyrimidine 5'-nucleotidase [Bradyrhizobium erythrophlei]|uniref:Putative hydrolase of the HAD superfamily n=1 Tax=Bradyrhizobium erythrophlei TaxID=1437360 RepID=A0A1M7TAT7_9BRAD|nr:pyrimidine 5'-nucleotidase [Bradyrhizobium erythrophlei]SHN67767.1 putative hydrolase of the HAD superfamily [Bradyrhizobium erythrophlei]
MRESFAHVDTWVFDLDDTLYPRSVDLHGQMRDRVVTFIANHMKIDRTAAEAVHRDYYERFGSTLQAMVQLHGVSPNAFLDFVHQIDLSVLVHNEDLIGALRALPGRRIIFTNAPRGHATSALKAMGMADLFEAIASIEDSAFIGKPNLSAFSGFFEAHGVDPKTAAMFEDRPGNLLVPHELSMKTVLVVDPLFEDADRVAKPAHADLIVTDLTGFLRQLVRD